MVLLRVKHALSFYFPMKYKEAFEILEQWEYQEEVERLHPKSKARLLFQGYKMMHEMALEGVEPKK